MRSPGNSGRFTSDKSRLVAAYTLALSAASESLSGLHPGIVILDEPLQQNPDKEHKELFLSFLTKELARKAKFQTVIFTYLLDEEIVALRKQGTRVVTPEGEHFLKLVTAEKPKADPPKEGSPASEASSQSETNGPASEKRSSDEKA